VILLFPFLVTRTLHLILELYTGLAKQYPYITLNAFNLWWFFTDQAGPDFRAAPPDNVPWWSGMTPKTIGFGLLALVTLFVIVAVFLGRGERRAIWLGALALALAFFCLPTEIHERYGYPILPAALVAALLAGRRYWVLAVVLSLGHFLNLVFAASGGEGAPRSAWAWVVGFAQWPFTGRLIAVINLACLVGTVMHLGRLTIFRPPRAEATVITSGK